MTYEEPLGRQTNIAPPRPRRSRRALVLLTGAVSGVLAAAVALGVAELVSALFRPQASPVIGIGETAIDHTPPALKNFAVQNFGSDDKIVLLSGIYAVIAIIAMIIGCIARRWLVVGMIGIGLFGGVGMMAELTRPTARTTDMVPSLVGAIAGVAALAILTRSSIQRRFPAHSTQNARDVETTHSAQATQSANSAHSGQAARSAWDTHPTQDMAPRNAHDPRYAHDPRSARNAPDPHNAPDLRNAGDPHDPRDAHDPRNARDPRYAHDPRSARDPHDLRDGWDTSPARHARDSWDAQAATPSAHDASAQNPRAAWQADTTPGAQSADAFDIAGIHAADRFGDSGALDAPDPAFWSNDSHRSAPRPVEAVNRRRFVVTSVAAVATAATTGAVGSRLLNSRFSIAKSRAAVRLRPPASVPLVTANVDLKAPGLSPFYTPNKNFYRVDTALTLPTMSADAWSLRIHGMVRNEIRLNFAELLRRPMIERDITLTCVSDEVGGPYIGNARWQGVRLADLLREAGVDPRADQIVSKSSDGFSIGTPTAVVMDGRDAMLAVGMNGEPRPAEHGFPVRMVVPGLYGYVSACKWIVDIELTTFASYDAYWVKRGWSQQALIKTESRIDTPHSGKNLPAGKVIVAGVTWAQHRGVKKVDVRVDGGAWQPARLAGQDTIDTWRQWAWAWDATPGTHTLEVRATDRTGVAQTAQQADPEPNGATGFHSVSVTVA